MAIQIDEKLLSIEARELLKNAKNKSQLLRDAIDFYAKFMKGDMPGGNQQINFHEDIVKDIKDIKEMMLSYKNPVSEMAADIQYKEPDIIKLETKEIRRNTNHKEREVVSNNILIQDEPVEVNETINMNDSEMTQQEKDELERMLDMSLNNF